MAALGAHSVLLSHKECTNACIKVGFHRFQSPPIPTPRVVMLRVLSTARKPASFLLRPLRHSHSLGKLKGDSSSTATNFPRVRACLNTS